MHTRFTAAQVTNWIRIAINMEDEDNHRGEKRKEPEQDEEVAEAPGDNSDSEKGKEKESPKKKVRYHFIWPSAKEPTQLDYQYRQCFTHQVSSASYSFASFTPDFNPYWF